MKKIKLLVSMLLSMTFIFSNISFSSANTVNGTDIYRMKYEESVNIDGIKYTYKYYYDNNGNRTTEVIDTSTGNVDVIKYDENNGKLLLNGENILLSENVETEKNVQTRASDFVYIGSVDKTITWNQASNAATVAGLIASVIGIITGAQVLSMIGSAVLSNIISKSANGRVRAKAYKLQAGKVTTYKYIWSFTPANGSKYGDYTSYVEG